MWYIDDSFWASLRCKAHKIRKTILLLCKVTGRDSTRCRCTSQTGWDWPAAWLWSDNRCILCNHPQFNNWSCMWNVLMQVLSSYDKNSIPHCLSFINELLCCKGVGNSDDIRGIKVFSVSFHMKAKIQVCHTNLHNKAFRGHKCRVIDYFLYSKYPCSISAASNEQQATVLPTVVVA